MLSEREKRGLGVKLITQKRKRYVVGPTYSDLAARFGMHLTTLLTRMSRSGMDLKSALLTPKYTKSQAGMKGKLKQIKTKGEQS